MDGAHQPQSAPTSQATCHPHPINDKIVALLPSFAYVKIACGIAIALPTTAVDDGTNHRSNRRQVSTRLEVSNSHMVLPPETISRFFT